MNKRVFLFLCLFCAGLTNYAPIQADQDDFDSLLDDSNTEITEFLDTHPGFNIGARSTTPEDVITVLVDIIGADQILQEDIFLKTNRLVTRSLLDNPLFIMDKNYCYGNWVLGVSLFYEETNRMQFTRVCSSGGHKQKYDKASCIKSYLALTSDSLVCRLKELENKIKDIFADFGFDCVRALQLFKNATAQERRAGFFFSFMGQIRDFEFSFKAPFYYMLRNFYLTDEERKAIAREFGDSDDNEAMRFARQHIISDKLGLGDLRFECDYPVSKKYENFESRLGVLVTLPTNIAMIKGLYGREFKPIKRRPTIDFVELFDLAQNDNTREEAIKIVKDLGLCALDGISSILLDSSLGNGRHVGIGLLMKTRTPLSVLIRTDRLSNIFYHNRMSIEFLFSAMENRWYIEKNDPSLFNRDYKDESKADENLAFLEKMFIDKFFPYVYETKVSPGFIFRSTSKLVYEGKRWGIHVGSDTWVITQEKLSEICAPKEQLALLDIEKARKPWAYQWSLFGSVFFKTKRKKSDLYVGLNIDGAFSSRGVGRPYKVTLSFERNF